MLQDDRPPPVCTFLVGLLSVQRPKPQYWLGEVRTSKVSVNFLACIQHGRQACRASLFKSGPTKDGHDKAKGQNHPCTPWHGSDIQRCQSHSGCQAVGRSCSTSLCNSASRHGHHFHFHFHFHFRFHFCFHFFCSLFYTLPSMYVCMYLCVRRCPPKPPTHAHMLELWF